MSGLLARGWKALEKREQQTIQEKIEATYGPNPCQRMEFQHEDGTVISRNCESKRCEDCGPRKRYLFHTQLIQSHQGQAYVVRTDDLTVIDRELERLKKRHQRGQGELPLYTIVGNENQGWLVISDVKLHEDQKRRNLRDWMERIMALWLGARRVRRSRSYGRLSLVPRSSKSNGGHKSLWQRLITIKITSRELQQLEEERKRSQMIEAAGFEPYEWDAWEHDGEMVSTVTAWKEPGYAGAL